MNVKERVLVNTIAQYTKTFFSGVITLYSSRIILNSLGVEDFGIYTLIAGVVMMLSFLTNALSSTTQRFISYNQGKHNVSKVKYFFCNSFYLHLFIGISLVAVSFLLSPLLFNGFLNIPTERLSAAKRVYIAVIFTLFLSFITSPFRALLISHENIVFTSIIDFIDAVLKLLIAFSLSAISVDARLAYYGWMLLSIKVFNLIVQSSYCFVSYPECVIPYTRYLSTNCLKQLSSFAGWNVYTLLCTLGRTQGIAVVLNRFLGPIVNTAYGLGVQLSSYANYMSESILNAMRPQIVKSEGAGNRERTFIWSIRACKYSFFLLSLISIPSLFEMPSILTFWLGSYPKEAVVFCRMFMFAGVVDSLSIGLHSANQAIGNVRGFTLRINTLKLCTLLFSIVLLERKCTLFYVAFIYVMIEFACAIWRIAILREDGLDIKRFINMVFCRELLPVLICVVTCSLITHYCSFNFRFLLTFAISILVYSVAIYIFGLEIDEKKHATDVLRKIVIR